MWFAQLSRREFFELCLGSSKVLEGRVRTATAVTFNDEASLYLYWEQDPLEQFSLPNLVVVPDAELQVVISAVAAAPQAPSPITSLCRILTREEARQHFDTDLLLINEAVLPALTTLAMVESLLHGDGRLGLKQLTPMICKRTLSYAWGRAISARSGPDSFVELPNRWLEAYGMINPPSATEAAQRTVEAMISVLSVVTQISMGLRPESTSGALSYELLYGNRETQEMAWQKLARCINLSISIEALLSATREERGNYLQQALKTVALNGSVLSSAASVDEFSAACAFIATRVAPGSLEHFDVLRGVKSPSLLVWYGLYATLQAPKELMSFQGGLGFRVLRDISRIEEKLSSPIADVGYFELKTLGRSSVDTLSGKLGHAGEIQVELVPYVTATFTFQMKNRTRLGANAQQQEFSPDGPEPYISPRVRLSRLAADMAQLARELPDSPIDDYTSLRKSRKKSG